MKSFIKAYLATVIMLNILSLGINIIIFRESVSTILYLLSTSWPRAAVFSGTLVVLMVVIGLPFFRSIQKRRNFSLGFSIFLWWIVTIIANYTLQLFDGEEQINIMSLGILVFGVICGLIFSAFYAWFKKRDKLVPVNLHNTFR